MLTEEQRIQFLQAAETGDNAAIEALFTGFSSEQIKEVLNAEDDFNMSLLHYFVYDDNTKTIKWLLEHGANINAGDNNGNTPLHIAVLNDNFEIVKLLVEHRANTNARNNSDSTPLHIAVRNGQTKTVKWLIQHDADINSTEHEGNTPLHIAVLDRKIETAKCLIEHGADTSIRDNYGYTSLHLAAIRGDQTETVKWLLEYGANINAGDNNGNTALYSAVNQGHTETSLTLLKEGAETDESLLEIINELGIEDIKLVQHPEKQGVYYDKNAEIKPWQRYEVAEKSNQEVIKLEQNIFASSLFGFQIGFLPLQGISEHVAKHLFPVDNGIFSPKNLTQLATNTLVCKNWCESVREGFAKYEVSSILELPAFGRVKFQSGFAEILEKQREENKKQQGESKSTVGNN